ncbi:hypothetical protein ACJ8AZ_14820 [Klebsiella pneumoniae]
MAYIEVAITGSATAVAKSTPGAIGSRKPRSGEFCKGADAVHGTATAHVAHKPKMDTGILHLTGRSCHDNKSQRADRFVVLSRMSAGKLKYRKGSFYCSDPP